LYTLLCGFPPFYDESIQTLTEKVARGQYTFLSPWWDDISKSAQDLVSHLLTVDPNKRYDIKQFLAHPWIREAFDEPTYAAADAPPLATPLTARTNPQTGRLQPDFAYLDDTPGRGRQDFRSPGAVNLREVFDVGYAVHRQEEEGKRRKNFKQGYRGGINNLNSLNEGDEDFEDEDEYNHQSMPYDSNQSHPPAKLPKSATGASAVPGGNNMDNVERQMRNTSLSSAAQARQQHAGGHREQKGYGQHSPQVAAAARRQVKTPGAFELSLDNATLLGRRGNKKGPSSLREGVTAS
jgi:serine/threonine-protein kinase RCK2